MLRLNSVPRLEYWADPEWLAVLDGIGVDRSHHRRHWEWAQVAYGLNRLGMLHENSRGLGVGVGKEPLVFYLAGRAGEVVATDMYVAAWARDGQANPSMLTDPGRFSPIPFPRERLRVMRMNALALDFPESSFDFIWSVGSIEHFGNSLPKHAFRIGCRLLGLRKLSAAFDHRGAAKAAREMCRVLKPGGVAALTTEVVLNGRPHHEFFLPDELRRFIVEPGGMALVEEEIVLHPSPRFMERVLPKEKWSSGETPHVVLRDQNGVEFTAVSLFLRKPWPGGGTS